MPDQAPLVVKLECLVPAQGTAGTVQDTTIGEAPFAGTVTAVYMDADDAVTANGTNYRTFAVTNKGQAGAGTAVVASRSTASVSLVADDRTDFTLSVTPADLVVAAGDVLIVNETVAATGVAHGGGKVYVELTRSA